MIIGIICKCNCKKEFVINISKTNNLDRESMRIYNKWDCPNCQDLKLEQGGIVIDNISNVRIGEL